jgi:hypothetical protein
MVLWIVGEWMEQLAGENDVQNGTGPKYSACGEVRDACKILIGNSDGKSLLGRPSRKC